MHIGRFRHIAPTFLALTLASSTAQAALLIPGFHKGSWFNEQVREQVIAEGVRVIALAPLDFDASKPTRLVIFATPNGNTIEYTLGCGNAPGIDWHFDGQHVAAQIRKMREIVPTENIVVACTEADGLSWPAWKRKYSDGPARIRKVVDAIRAWIPGNKVRITLACHSGGGSFLFGFIDGGDSIPPEIERFVFLDANYSYSDADKHGDKLIAWLKENPAHRLVVIAYDDREITLNGKKVLGPTGGTFRATERMRTRFVKDMQLVESKTGDFRNDIAMDGQVAFHVHPNPANKILHTILVGDMNGLLRGLTDEKPNQAWGAFGGPRAYSNLVQPAPTIPDRPADAPGGIDFFHKIASLKGKGGVPAQAYEDAVAAEILRGNFPPFLRSFQKVTVKAKDKAGKEHTITYEVMPDYLAVGSDADFVRVPMSPLTATNIADVFGCALPTRKMVNEIHEAATVKLEPRPLTKEREFATSFVEHNKIIEGQREGKKLGDLVSGIKKDLIVTNKLGERPNRVAIYGWHLKNGKPIQPNYIGHVDWYVDYSHGIRLVKRIVTVDGKPRDIRQILCSGDLSPLVSDEGVLRHPSY